ncbi:MAG TPA: ABC transporter permease [Candidatus Angelobacter sp.]|jgi:predicted permease
MQLSEWVYGAFKDGKYTFRQFARNPFFAIVATFSLGIGIGANTAIFSVMDAVLLRSLPVRDPKQLVMLTNPNFSGRVSGLETGNRSTISYPEFQQLREHVTTLSGLCASESEIDHWDARVSGGSPEVITGRLVSDNYFSIFGVEPAEGNFFNADRTGDTKQPYVVVSYDFWQRRFGSNAAALGSTITIYGNALTVIGVAARDFKGETVGESPDIWIPISMQPLVRPGQDWLHENPRSDEGKFMWLHAFGRLKPGVTRAQAQAEIDVIFNGMLRTFYSGSLPPDTLRRDLNQHLIVSDASTGVFEDRSAVSKQLFIIFAAAGLVLIIACANLTNLLLARMIARHREVGIRLSIGAGRSRLVRQFLTESLLLSIFGGVIGLLLSSAGARALVLVWSRSQSPWNLSTAISLRVLAFTSIVTGVTAIVLGLTPAFRASRINVIQSLKETSQAVTASGRRVNLAKMLIVIQVALSVLLVVGAGLFSRTLWNLQSVKLGFEKEGLLLIQVNGLTAGYHDAQLTRLYREIVDSLHGVPGVRGMTYSANGLFSDIDAADYIEVEGFTPQTRRDTASRSDQSGSDYFSVLGVPIVRGRDFRPQDTAASPQVCIINEAFAKRFFANRDPLGRHVTDVIDGSNKVSMEVIGVVRNLHDQRLRGEVQPRFYMAADQGIGKFPSAVFFEIRVAGDPEQMIQLIRKSILGVNGNLSIVSAHPLAELVDHANAEPRAIADFCAFFALSALALAAIGLYGVMSYGIARRTSEIGLRMALGAGRASVLRMVLREAVIMVLIGSVIGVVAAVLSTRIVSAQLYGLSAFDPFTLIFAVCLLSLISLAAAIVPALRAARVDPLTALRQP